MTAAETAVVILATWAACFVLIFLFCGFMTWMDKHGHGDPFGRLLDWMAEFWEKRL